MVHPSLLGIRHLSLAERRQGVASINTAGEKPRFIPSFRVWEEGCTNRLSWLQIIPKKSPATQKNPSLKYYKLRDFTSTIPIFLKIFQNNRCSRTRVFTHACLNSLNRAFNMCLLNSIGLRTTGLG